MIDKFYKLDKELSNELSLMYFDWVFNRSFSFDYCDVIIGYITKIYEITVDLDVKSRAVIVSAELARTHNRWYVMKYVVKMASPDINENLAFRISLELEIESRNTYNFKRCVEGINLSISSYHETIKNILADSK